VDLNLGWYSMFKGRLGNGSADLYDRRMPDGKVRDERNFRQKRAHAARPSAPFELPCSTNHIYDLDASSDRVSTRRHRGKKAEPQLINPPRFDRVRPSVGRWGHRAGPGADLTEPNMPEHVPQ
jgi:hypothetical protein